MLGTSIKIKKLVNTSCCMRNKLWGLEGGEREGKKKYLYR